MPARGYEFYLRSRTDDVSPIQQHIRVLFKDVRAQKFPRTNFFFKFATQKGNDLLLPRRPKKLGVTDFVLEEHTPKNTLNLKNRVSSPNKAAIRSLN